jgi:hypothetical protein
MQSLLQLANIEPGDSAPDPVASLLSVAARVLESAEADPQLLQSLIRNPLEVASAAGLDTWTLLRTALSLDDASDSELVDVLRRHILRLQDRYAAGCGACGPSTCGVESPDE